MGAYVSTGHTAIVENFEIHIDFFTSDHIRRVPRLFESADELQWVCLSKGRDQQDSTFAFFIFQSLSAYLPLEEVSSRYTSGLVMQSHYVRPNRRFVIVEV